MNKLIAIIPAKGHSERVKSKNSRIFVKSSLLDLKIKQCINSKSFSDIIVSSDCKKIHKIALSNGVSIDKRPKDLCLDSTKSKHLYYYIGKKFESHNIAWTLCTHPFFDAIEIKNIIKYYKLFKVRNTQCVSVTELKNFFIYKNKILNFNPFNLPKTQDVQPLLLMNAAMTLTNGRFMKKKGALHDTGPLLYRVNSLQGFDIDTELEFKIAKILMQNKNEIIDKYR